MKKYSSYKPTSINWISEIPEHWSETKLKYIGYLYAGLTGKSGDDFNQDLNPLSKSFIPFTNIANNEKINPENLQSVVINEDENQNEVKKWDLFFMMSSENFDDVGKATILLHDLKEVYLNSFCKGFRVTDKNVNPLFLNYLLFNDAYRRRMMIEANGFTRINLKMEKVNDFEIALPPVEEQISIAEYLENRVAQIDKLIANKQKLIALLKEECASLINEAVSGDGKKWEKKKLKYLAKLRDELIADTDFKIAVENIESGSGKLVNTDEVKKYEGQLSAFKKGDTIFNKLRPYLHKVYFADKDGGLFGELLIIYSQGELIPEFLFYHLFSKKFIDIVDGSTQGIKMPRANWDFIRHLLISYPKDKKEQSQIVNYIKNEMESIDNTVTKVENEIERMKEYRKALISEAVTGKIKVI